jgi:hypothetical protein
VFVIVRSSCEHKSYRHQGVEVVWIDLQERNRSELERFDKERGREFLNMIRGFVHTQVNLSLSLDCSLSYGCSSAGCLCMICSAESRVLWFVIWKLCR